MTPQELAGLLDTPHPPLVLDVRTRSQYESDPTQIQIPGSVRILPDDIAQWGTAQPFP